MRRRRSEGGFTLLEVLVALLIFALAFGVLAQIFQTGLQQSATAERMGAATMLARSQLARIGIDLPFETAEDDEIIALLVEVAVAWGPAESERQVALTSLRLAPVASEDRP